MCEMDNIRFNFEQEVILVFGSVETFLNIVEDGSFGHFNIIRNDEEIYIIDRNINCYINWYKLNHIGRDFNTDMKSLGEILNFLLEFKNNYEVCTGVKINVNDSIINSTRMHEKELVGLYKKLHENIDEPVLYVCCKEIGNKVIVPQKYFEDMASKAIKQEELNNKLRDELEDTKRKLNSIYGTNLLDRDGYLNLIIEEPNIKNGDQAVASLSLETNNVHKIIYQTYDENEVNIFRQILKRFWSKE